ncbi:MAG: GNAT family N-acetyltransferase [Armatimonadota bacterium]|nr:GNAT family N-acetyltransferase [Armatimonadota bacterium]
MISPSPVQSITEPAADERAAIKPRFSHLPIAPAPVTVRQASAQEEAGWDELVMRFPHHRIFHKRCWLNLIKATAQVKPLNLVFVRGSEVVGCIPGFVMIRCGVRIYGSALPGWQTLSMGPLFDPDRVSTRDLVCALLPFLEKKHGIHHVEITTPDLDPETMQDLGFEGEPVFTLKARLLPGRPDELFNSLPKKARRNIRKGTNLGVVINVEEDESFVEEMYDQIIEAYTRNGAAVPFTRQRVLECFRLTRASGNLMALSISHPDDGVKIAAAMYMIEGTEMTMWAWAHRTRYRSFYPTEVMTWTAMSKAMERGCDTFDMAGGNDFKRKFGAEPSTTVYRWIRSRYLWLGTARTMAQKAYRWQQSVRGNMARKKVTAATPASGEEEESSE